MESNDFGKGGRGLNLETKETKGTMGGWFDGAIPMMELNLETKEMKGTMGG